MTNINSKTGFSAISSNYTDGFRVGARKCVPLALKLEHVAPRDLTADERARLETLKARAQEVDDVITWRQRGTSSFLGERRRRHVVAFTALQQRIGAMAGLGPDMGPKAAEAEFLQGTLFSDGVSLAALDGVEGWQHGARLRSRIEREGLRARIDAIAGPEFMAMVDRTNRELGDAIGVTGASSEPPPPPRALADAIQRFVVAVCGYARAHSAMVYEDRPETIERFTKAVAPIDEMRSRESSGDEEDEEVDAPTETPAPVVAAPTEVTPAVPIEPGMPGADPFIRNQ